MGNSFGVVMSSIVGIYYKLLEKASSYRSEKNPNPYYSHEILLKDNECQAVSVEESKTGNIHKSTSANNKLAEEVTLYQLMRFNEDHENQRIEEENLEMEDIKKELGEIKADVKPAESHLLDKNYYELKDQIFEDY